MTRRPPRSPLFPSTPLFRSQINALQRAATIVLQKSVRESFGLGAAEAMWKGKPVIGGFVGGLPQQIVYDEAADDRLRSEEHTSELQSQSNLVCRLLLEKKKN